MPPQPYKRPPITEAVIQIRFPIAIEPDQLGKVSRSFDAEYPAVQDVKNLDVQVQLDAQQQVKPSMQFREETGHRRSSLDQTQILVLSPSSLIVSQLAPYPGWDEFFPRFTRDWEIWKRTIGYRKIDRIGVRYINRVDIPATGPIIQQEHYLNVYVQLPKELGPTLNYAVQALLPLPTINCFLTINSAVVPSPLLGHVSFVLDVDIARIADVPQNDADILNLLAQIRDKKNEIFEACITPKARELFEPWPQ